MIWKNRIFLVLYSLYVYIIKYKKFYFFFIKVGYDVVVEVFFEFFVCAGRGVLVVL